MSGFAEKEAGVKNQRLMVAVSCLPLVKRLFPLWWRELSA